MIVACRPPRPRSRGLLAAAITAIALLVAAPHAQAPAGVIDGGVVDDAGAAVVGASVSLLAEAGGLLRAVTTDRDGAYMFDALPEGRYAISASRVGHTTRIYGQTSAAAERVVIALDANGRYRARLKLQRLGAISGTISDENGQSAGVQVHAARLEMTRGVRTPGTDATVTAGRDGRYKFTDLAPGDYLISAMGPDGEMRTTSPEAVRQAALAIMQPGQPAPKPAVAASTVSYVKVYYPGVLSRSRASAVALGPGADLQGINLQLQVVPTARVDGTVFDGDNKPLPYVTVTLSTTDDGEVWSYGQATTSGYFRLAPVPFGPYRVSISLPAQYVPRPPRTMTSGWWAAQDVVLGQQDGEHLTVRAEPATRITGSVTFDGTAARPDCSRTPCTLELTKPGVTAPGLMDEAGVVVIVGVAPGEYTIRQRVPIKGWTMASATIDGRDAMDLPLDVPARQDLTGLAITLTDAETTLTGTTPVGTGDSPMADAVSIVIFPADRAMWRAGARRVRVARPDTSGRYRVTGLPPGDYLAAVVTNFDAEQELDAGRLAALAATASPVAVRRPGAR